MISFCRIMFAIFEAIKFYFHLQYTALAHTHWMQLTRRVHRILAAGGRMSRTSVGVIVYSANHFAIQFNLVHVRQFTPFECVPSDERATKAVFTISRAATVVAALHTIVCTRCIRFIVIKRETKYQSLTFFLKHFSFVFFISFFMYFSVLFNTIFESSISFYVLSPCSFRSFVSFRLIDEHVRASYTAHSAYSIQMYAKRSHISCALSCECVMQCKSRARSPVVGSLRAVEECRIVYYFHTLVVLPLRASHRLNIFGAFENGRCLLLCIANGELMVRPFALRVSV